MAKPSNIISIFCSDCKKGFVLKIGSLKKLVTCPICKKTDPLSFGSSNVAGH
jgi:hypothetical protein